MEKFNLFLSAPILKQLRALAKRKDVSIAELVRLAIAEFLAKHGD